MQLDSAGWVSKIQKLNIFRHVTLVLFWSFYIHPVVRYSAHLKLNDRTAIAAVLFVCISVCLV